MVTDSQYRRRMAVKSNVEAVQESAERQGLQATFLMVTFRRVDHWRKMKREVTVFFKRLKERTGRCGVYVWERGALRGRPHVHCVLDGFVAIGDIEKCKAGLGYIGHTGIEKTGQTGPAQYMYKEMWKQAGRRDVPGRRWGRFGRLWRG